MSTPPRDSVLKYRHNKIQLNKLLYATGQISMPFAQSCFNERCCAEIVTSLLFLSQPLLRDKFSVRFASKLFYFCSPAMPSLKPESKLSNDNTIPYNKVEPVYIFQQPLENMMEISSQILLLRAVCGCHARMQLRWCLCL